MNALQEVKQKELKSKKLLSNSKKIDSEVYSYKEKLSKYGIKNKTAKSIDNVINKINEEKENVGKKEAINILINTFSPFSIVEYKTLNEVCNDHKLSISSISNYDKAIPDENVEDMDSFIEKLKGMDNSVLSKVKASVNYRFTFDKTRNYFYFKRNTDWNYYDRPIETEEMFKIAAPKSHFDIPKNHTKIGNEYHSLGIDKPKFKYEFKLSKPTFELDPIVFIPISFLNKIYCVIVTAWDKEADDSRILSKL